ncbi:MULTISPECIES: phenylacetaldoxime dehydratase family protein [unclassified Streptomyces]|uniref:phenylacetaldoxime dehydratase family protein n=1 Tax=unclassified Streptomyces TaxID=2593676 RepID=UPI000DDB48AE|nr:MULTISPECIES: phenylacetaldoxime dehydratase family protein [unclassified Streptomyces]QZZ25184.1 phenylacetaldoxime dehydratase family protein [Streptomyces sp. ST1015]
MPATPRFPAYSLVFPPHCGSYVFGQYAFQADSAERAAALADAARSLFTGPDAPTVVDRGTFTDRAGAHNAVWYAHWLDPAAHRRWVAATGRGQPPTAAAHWWEEATVPVRAQSSLQTHPTSAFPVGGLARVLPQRVENTHDYWGALRDRIPDSTVPAAPTVRADREQDTVRLSVDGGLCMIRFAQDWTGSTVFRDPFLHSVLPVMRRAVEDLEQHPKDTGCVAVREVREHATDGTPLERSSVLAWFASLQALLDWARTHPRHQAIYAAFFTVLGDGTTPLDVALWNEAAALPAGSVEASYTRCHDRTGFLPLLPHEPHR